MYQDKEGKLLKILIKIGLVLLVNFKWLGLKSSLRVNQINKFEEEKRKNIDGKFSKCE